jgi:hypothetical protein
VQEFVRGAVGCADRPDGRERTEGLPGEADQWMLKMRPSPGRQSTLMTPLLIFQSVALLVSMVICACAGQVVRDKTIAIAARGRCFIGEGLQLSDGRRSGCRF